MLVTRVHLIRKIGDVVSDLKLTLKVDNRDVVDEIVEREFPGWEIFSEMEKKE